MLRKDLNFFDVYKKGPGSHRSGSTGLIAMTAGLVLAVGLTFGGLWLVNQRTRASIDALNAAMDSPQAAQQQQSAARDSLRNQRYRAYLNAAAAALKRMDALLRIDSAVYQELAAAKPAEVSLRSTSVSVNAVSVTCSSPQFSSAALFTASLNSSSRFENASCNAITLGSGGAYEFTITFTLKNEGDSSDSKK